MINGTFTSGDLLDATWVHMRPRPSIAVAGAIVLALGCWALWYVFFGENVAPIVWVRWLIVGGFAYFALFFGVAIPYKCRRTYRQRKDLQRECTFEASDAGLTTETQEAHGLKPWGDYLKWKEGRRVFLLYLSDNLYQMIPKRFFTSELDLTAFRELLMTKVPRREA